MALVMCLTLMITLAVSASAASADEEAGTYGFVSPCLNCGAPITHNITRVYKETIPRSCVHGIQGAQDLCDCYEVTDNYACRECGKKGPDVSFQYVVRECLGN